MTRKLLFTLLALTTSFAQAAFAAPMLRAEAIVSAPVVTVGDLFQDAGSFAEEPMFRAPPLGTTGTLSLDEIAAAAERLGLAGYTTGAVERLRVSRPGTTIDQSAVAALVTDSLAARGIVTEMVSAQVRFDRPLPGLTAEAVTNPLALEDFTYEPGRGRFRAALRLAGQEGVVAVSGEVELTIAAPHLAQNLPAGTVIGPSDIEMRQVPVRFADGSGFVRLEDALGKQLQRATRAGVMLRPSDLGEPMAVIRNEPVTLYYRQGPLTLTVKGQAISSAALGSPVSVLNSMSKRVITGIAIGTGAVEVRSPAPLDVAGLQ